MDWEFREAEKRGSDERTRGKGRVERREDERMSGGEERGGRGRGEREREKKGISSSEIVERDSEIERAIGGRDSGEGTRIGTRWQRRERGVIKESEREGRGGRGRESAEGEGYGDEKDGIEKGRWGGGERDLREGGERGKEEERERCRENRVRERMERGMEGDILSDERRENERICSGRRGVERWMRRCLR
ncbi:hypothetical protein Tco_0696020 [Tanacetum coccineum]